MLYTKLIFIQPLYFVFSTHTTNVEYLSNLKSQISQHQNPYGRIRKRKMRLSSHPTEMYDSDWIKEMIFRRFHIYLSLPTVSLDVYLLTLLACKTCFALCVYATANARHTAPCVFRRFYCHSTWSDGSLLDVLSHCCAALLLLIFCIVQCVFAAFFPMNCLCVVRMSPYRMLLTHTHIHTRTQMNIFVCCSSSSSDCSKEHMLNEKSVPQVASVVLFDAQVINSTPNDRQKDKQKEPTFACSLSP